MMRQILALVLAAAFSGTVYAGSLDDEFDRLPAKPAKKSLRKKSSMPGRKRLDEMHTTQDRWDELQSDNALQRDDEREAYRTPAHARSAVPRPANRPAATISASGNGTRAPASTPSALTAGAPAAVVFPVASLTFDEYLSDNGRNPAMNRRIPDHQKAFADTSAPAVLSLPGSESPSTAANPAAAAGGNASAIQAAAAAAAAAGLIPAGAAAGSPASAPAGGPVR